MELFKISFGIIIVFMILELYINYSDNNNNKNKKITSEDEDIIEEELDDIDNLSVDDVEMEVKNDYANTITNGKDEIVFDTPNPWCKIIVGDNTTKYFIKINNFQENRFIEWKKIIDNLDYDIKNKDLILETSKEAEALALVNLIISTMNDDITLEDVISNKLISISIRKAKSHKLVCNKLIELIKENNSSKSNNIESLDSSVEYSVDTDNSIPSIQTPPKSNLNNLRPNYLSIDPQPYAGIEYSLFN